MEKNSKRKLLVCGDSLNQTTGFSYVISSIVKHLIATDQYEICYATITGSDTTPDGLSAQGAEFAEAAQNIQLTNVQVNDKAKARHIDKVMEQFAPEIVLTSHDPWYVDTIAYSPYRDSFYWAAYMTVEVPEYPAFVMSPSPILPTNRKPIRDIMSRASVVIPHTKMGYDMFTKHWELDNVSEFCYSGVDFDQRCTEEVSKSEAFGESVSEDDFIFMTMGFNSERKKIDRVIESFYRFKQKHKNPKYKLYIHTDVNAQTGGTDLRTLVGELGLMDDILIPTSYQAGVGIDKKDLYRRYQASDCYIGLPSGEGFGYGFAEAMMHGKPLIYINYGGHTCYCKPAGLGVKVNDFVHARYAYMKWALADMDDAAKQMGRMVSDQRFRDSAAKKGFEIARDQLDWKVTFPKWHDAMLSRYNPNEISKLAGVPMRRIV